MANLVCGLVKIPYCMKDLLIMESLVPSLGSTLGPYCKFDGKWLFFAETVTYWCINIDGLRSHHNRVVETFKGAHLSTITSSPIQALGLIPSDCPRLLILIYHQL